MNNANSYLIGYFAERLGSLKAYHLTMVMGPYNGLLLLLLLKVTLLLDMCEHSPSSTITSKFLFSVTMVTLLLTHPLPQSLHIKVAINLVSMVSSIMPFCVLVS